MEKYTIYEQLLNLPTLSIDNVLLADKSITITCHVTSPSHICPNCGQACERVNQYYTRTIRDLNMGSRYVYLAVKVRQFICNSCNRYFTETLDFADLNKDYTHRQEYFMFCIARKQSYTETAAIFDVSPKTVERIVLSKCDKIIELENRYANVKRLGIDEHSHKKGKKDYLCVLTDLDKGTIIDLLPDRKKETLIAHFQGLGTDFCNQITDVACDYWDAYISTSQTCFPNARIILDRFHITKLLNQPLDVFRKEIRKNDKDIEPYKKLKWILFKQYHTLSDKQLDALHKAFELCPDLKKIYFAREQFHHILDNSNTVQKALCGIQDWTAMLAKNQITVFQHFVKTLHKTKEFVANYVQDYLSNAVTEGLNNLIRSVRRTAFGMTNFNNLRLRVLAISN